VCVKTEKLYVVKHNCFAQLCLTTYNFPSIDRMWEYRLHNYKQTLIRNKDTDRRQASKYILRGVVMLMGAARGGAVG